MTLRRYWLGRFEARQHADGSYALRDWLQPAGRTLKPEVFAGLQGGALDLAFFQHGFVRAAVSAVGAAVAQQHLGLPETGGALFWQFPCRTEAAAWDAHAQVALAPLRHGVFEVYLGLPWATWIDKDRKAAWGAGEAEAMQQQLRLLGVQFSGLRHALAEMGVGLKVHTVCQHIGWQDMVPAWQKLGVSDVWLSHCPGGERGVGWVGLALHPWALYAVNVEDPQRRAGLVLGKDVADRPVLASFAGAHMPHYLSDVRLRLAGLAGAPGFVVKLTDTWHFEAVVYQHQIGGQALAHSGMLDNAVASYNQLLSDSVFALCPSGAGPNTLRLWEALAVGAIPVLLGVQPVLPCGGSLAHIDWDRIVLRVPDEQVAGLPGVLHAMPLAERRERQRLGLQAYARVRGQRCF